MVLCLCLHEGSGGCFELVERAGATLEDHEGSTRQGSDRSKVSYKKMPSGQSLDNFGL